MLKPPVESGMEMFETAPQLIGECLLNLAVEVFIGSCQKRSRLLVGV